MPTMCMPGVRTPCERNIDPNFPAPISPTRTERPASARACNMVDRFIASSPFWSPALPAGVDAARGKFAQVLCRVSHMVPEFDWNDLRAFLAVAREGRLTAAARRLRIDQSTLSRRISGLEAALGTRFFDTGSPRIPMCATSGASARRRAPSPRLATPRGPVSCRAASLDRAPATEAHVHLTHGSTSRPVAHRRCRGDPVAMDRRRCAS